MEISVFRFGPLGRCPDTLSLCRGVAAHRHRCIRRRRRGGRFIGHVEGVDHQLLQRRLVHIELGKVGQLMDLRLALA